MTGSWFTFLVYEREHWRNRFGFIGTNVKNLVVNMFTWQPKESIILWVPQVAVFVMVITLTILSWRHLRFSYLLYVLLYLFVIYTPTWLLSSARYVGVLFPVFLASGLLTRKPESEFLVTVISAFLLAFFVFAFTQGFFLM